MIDHLADEYRRLTRAIDRQREYLSLQPSDPDDPFHFRYRAARERLRELQAQLDAVAQRRAEQARDEREHVEHLMRADRERQDRLAEERMRIAAEARQRIADEALAEPLTSAEALAVAAGYDHEPERLAGAGLGVSRGDDDGWTVGPDDDAA